MLFALNGMKPGLISKSFDVSNWAARLFSKIAFELADSKLASLSWEWFVGESKGISTVLMGM